MIHQNAKIISIQGRPQRSCTVRAQTLLSDFAHEGIESPHAYMIVESSEGVPVGVVGVEEIRRKLSSSSRQERQGWLNMPIESALSGRLLLRADREHPEDRLSEPFQKTCTAISQNGDLIALVSEDDVLVSWRSIEPLIQKAQNDHVTGLPTRSVFDSHLKAEVARASANGLFVAVILADVDYFKDINDRYGHAAGDAVLGAIGRTLRATYRSYDLVARYGGDEFAVLCCGCLPGEIDQTIERLRSGILNLRFDTSVPYPVPTLSIGACVVHNPHEIDKPELITQTADECLYCAKREGRNRSFSREIGIERLTLC